jgi:hypothetical protein
MATVAYTSRIVSNTGRAHCESPTLRAKPNQLPFSVHGAIAEHYKIDPASLTESHAATIDYVIAATAG